MIKSGIMFEQGEIVIIPFPFTDLTAIKQRPVLILSKREYNQKTDDIIICGITSNPKAAEFSVMIDNSNLETGSLPIASRIKVDKLFTLNQKLAKKQICKLNQETLDKVKKEIGLLFF